MNRDETEPTTRRAGLLRVSAKLLGELLLLEPNIEIKQSLHSDRPYELVFLCEGDGCPETRNGDVLPIVPMYRTKPPEGVELVEVRPI